MLRMISVFVIGLLPDFFAIAITSKKAKKLCAVVPHREPEPGTKCRQRGRLETVGMKMQPKNMVSGRKIAVLRLFPGENRLFAVFSTLPEPVLQPNAWPVIR
jgi:hypothetical protein